MKKKIRKVIVAGSRTFNDYIFLKETLDSILIEGDVIVSGGAKGADLLGEKYATENGYKMKRFKARWDLFGKLAGFHRNSEMVKYSDMLIAFWDRSSKGTYDTINKARTKGIEIHIVDFGMRDRNGKQKGFGNN